MGEDVWQNIERSAEQWLILEIYYAKSKTGEKKRYEILPISKRKNLLYAKDLLDEGKVKAFKISGIQLASVVKERKPPIEKSKMDYLVEIGAELHQAPPGIKIRAAKK